MFWSNYMGLLLWKGIENFKERYFLKVRLHANDDYFEAVTRIRNGCRFRVPSFNHKYKQMLRVFLKYWYIKRIEFPLCGEKFRNLSHWFSFYAQIIRCLYVASKIAGEGRGGGYWRNAIFYWFALYSCVHQKNAFIVESVQNLACFWEKRGWKTEYQRDWLSCLRVQLSSTHLTFYCAIIAAKPFYVRMAGPFSLYKRAYTIIFSDLSSWPHIVWKFSFFVPPRSRFFRKALISYPSFLNRFYSYS